MMFELYSKEKKDIILLKHLFKRPSVAGAVLQTDSCNSVSDGLWKYIHNTVNPKPEALESLNV